MQPCLGIVTWAEKSTRDIIFRNHKTAIRANAVRIPFIRARIKLGQFIKAYIYLYLFTH